MRATARRAWLPAVALGLAAAAAAGTDADALAPGYPSSFAVPASRARELYVATQRKDGSRSSVAPVWFGVLDGTILFATRSDSHKARRIGRGSPAWVSAEGPDGPFVEMRTEVLRDPALADRLGAVYRRKYWLAWAGFFRPRAEKITDGSTVLIRLLPK